MLHKRILIDLMTLIIMASLVGLPYAAAAPMATSPPLGAAESFVVLAGAAVTNVPTSAITGDVGLSPAAGSNYAGLTTADIVAGTIYAVDGTGPAGSVENEALLTTAKADLVTAYDGLAAQGCDVTYAGVQDLIGLTLVPGVYCATAFELSGVLTLNGADTDVWVFKSTSTLITSGAAEVVLSAGGVPCEVWWQVGSSATLGTNTSLAGNILALTSISLATDANLDGRALAQNGEVTLDSNTITLPICTPSAVDLLTFQARPLSNYQVQLQWVTAMEVDNFGFNLYRADVNDLAVAQSAGPIHFEPAVTQGSGSGATYTYVDAVPDAGPWWYWLSDVDTSELETFHDPVTITLYYVYLPSIER